VLSVSRHVWHTSVSVPLALRTSSTSLYILHVNTFIKRTGQNKASFARGQHGHTWIYFPYVLANQLTYLRSSCYHIFIIRWSCKSLFSSATSCTDSS